MPSFQPWVECVAEAVAEEVGSRAQSQGWPGREERQPRIGLDESGICLEVTAPARRGRLCSQAQEGQRGPRATRSTRPTVRGIPPGGSTAYFAFTAAWLNVFLLAGASQPTQLVLGFVAYFVIADSRGWFWSWCCPWWQYSSCNSVIRARRRRSTPGHGRSSCHRQFRARPC
jgi:hypothetical protein